MSDPVITFGSNANNDVVSAHTRAVLSAILKAAGVPACTITSTSRTPADQARAMYTNLKDKGEESQRKLYAAPGDAVIDVWKKARAAGKGRAEVEAAMVAEILRQGPSKVSRHCADPAVRNVVDVAPSSIPADRRKAFEKEIAKAVADGRIATFIGPGSGDPAYHLEVLQPAITPVASLSVPRSVPLPSAPAVPRVPLITRTEWGAKPPTKKLQALGAPIGVVVHHTAQGPLYAAASKPGCSAETGVKALRAIQNGHFARDFADVGYHFVIDGAGRIYQGRDYLAAGAFGPGWTPPRLALGAHVKGQHAGRIGVNLVGCFGGKGEANCDDAPSAAAVDALVRLLAALSAAYGVVLSDKTVVGHRDLAPNVCPGDRLYALLPDIRKRALAARDAPALAVA